MTQRQHTKKWWSRALSLLMAVLMTAQLSISVYAEMGVQPDQEETAASQVLTEATEEPQISTEETEATLATDPALNDEQENILPEVSADPEETQAATESEVPTVPEETQAVTEPAPSDIPEETQVPEAEKAAEPELFAQSSEFEYVEVTSVDQITSGATYAITYTADNGCCILYHKNTDNRSDQVSGTIADRKLTLCDFKNYPETTQTWTIDTVEGGGYTVKSCSGTNMYLNLNKLTNANARVPVSSDAQTVKITDVKGGFNITGTDDGKTSYLSHGGKGQFFVGMTACTVKLFKQTPKGKPSEPTDPLAIPGFTRVKDGKLEETKYYMIVSQDNKGNLYAFYPDAENKTVDPGNAIDPKHAQGSPEGTFVAELTVENGEVTAKRATKEHTALEKKDLCFTLQKNKAQWAFMDKNGLYLSLDKEMLAEKAQYFYVTEKSSGVFEIKNGYRHLDFNKHGDPNEFPSGFATNFWGPGENRFPLYLYTLDGETVEPKVNKAELIAAIDKAEKFDTKDFDQQSADALNAAKNAAVEERNNTASTTQTVKEATDKLVKAMQAMKPKAELMAPDRPNPDHGVTIGEPFPAGIGGSKTFRIPALTTLQNGWLAAAIDARWDNCPDGFGIDTLFSVSKDNGKTWEYNFPNYFNDSVDQYWGGGKNQGNATAFIDPVMIQGKDGTIYLMTDLYSGGTFIINAATNSGYEVIDGQERMAIHTSRDGKAGTYDYYVGDFARAEGDTKAYAPLIAKDDETQTAAYYVDEYYNLYNADKQPMYCKQLGTKSQPWSGKYVQQNVFFYNADLHVRRATFLWMVTSNDNGQTWSAPTIMNPMVRKRPATHRFYGVGPGAGLCLDDGTVMLPCYLHTPEFSSFIYKNPGEDTWHRSENATRDNSSESTLVQIDENTVRQFCRDGVNVVRYTDHKRDPATMEWKAQTPVQVEGVAKTTWNQVSALRYSREINGKPVILVSTASTGSKARENGKIYAFNLEDDANRSMKLIGTYEVNKPGQIYGYSSLTELKDGSIGLLYEDTWTHASYRNIELNEIIPSAIVDGKRSVKVSLYQSVEDKFEFKTLPTEEELAQMDSTVATAKVVGDKVVYTGNKVGQTSYVTGGVTVVVKVTEPDNIQEVPLEFGQTKDLTVESDKIQRNTNPDIVDAKITTIDKSVTVTGGQCHTGTNTSYNEKTEPLAKALHIFEADGEGFQAWTKDASGVKVWLNPGGQNGFPVSSHSVTTYFEEQKDGTFFVKTKDRYLAFWRDGKNVFDAGSSAGGKMTPLCKFKLYRPAENGEKSSAELPGYVQVTKRDQIRDGGLYLIAADYKNDSYILWPTTDSSSKYAHVAKADKAAQNVTHQVENKTHTLSLTGNAIGTSDVMVDDVIYRVTVTHDHVFGEDWTHDETNHWHQCECGEKTDVDAHSFGDWTVTKEPTETETGTKVHTCGVCGYEQTEQIPATGETTVDYKVIEGADGSFTKGTETTLTFRTNGDFSKFAGIKVDGVLVDASDYTANAEKSAVTLGAAYLDTLSVGTHKVTVLFEDGECSADFAVKEASVPTEPTKPSDPTKPSEPTKPGNPTTPGKPVKPNGNKPNTGDNSNAVLWGTLLLVSAAAIAGTVYSFKKKKHNG